MLPDDQRGSSPDIQPLASDLETRGIDVLSDTVSTDQNTGAFLYGSHVVVLHRRQRVPDSSEIDRAKPFHLGRCDSLTRIAGRTPPARHTVTNRRDGLFVMVLESGDGPVDHAVSLVPCKLCLAHLDYRGYRNASKADKASIVATFDLDTYFDESVAGLMPTSSSIPVAVQPSVQYPDNWHVVSRAVRDRASWTCAVCSVRCESHKALLHTHHLNGNKVDLRESNLLPLCMTCHRNMPGHEMMYVSPDHVATLARLREEQGRLTDQQTSMITP